jgi:uncharacterized membrane protein YjjB (DUF3815 family)
MELILAFFGSLCPAVLINVERRKFLWVGLAGSIGWLVFDRLLANTGQVILATFAGSVAVGLYSESMARWKRSPATVFSISGIFPLVPGIGAYNTAQFLVESKFYEAAGKGFETVASAGAIALGIMLMSSVFKGMGRVRRVASRE